MLDVVTSWATPTTLFILLNLVIGVIAVTSAFASPKKNQIQQQHPQQQQQPPSDQLGYDSPGSNRLTRSPSLFSRVTSFSFTSSPLNFTSFSAPSTPSATYDYSAAYNHLRSESFDDTEPRTPVPSYAVNDGTESPYTPPQRESKSSVAAAAPYTPSPKPMLTSSSPVSRSPSFLSRVTSFNFSFQRSEQTSATAETVVVQPKEEKKPVTEHCERTESEPIRMKWLDADEMLRKTASDMVEAEAVANEETAPIKNMKKKVGGVSKETVRFRGGKEKEEELVDAKADDFINRFKQQLRMQKLDSIIRRTENN